MGMTTGGTAKTIDEVALAEWGRDHKRTRTALRDLIGNGRNAEAKLSAILAIADECDNRLKPQRKFPHIVFGERRASNGVRMTPVRRGEELDVIGRATGHRELADLRWSAARGECLIVAFGTNGSLENATSVAIYRYDKAKGGMEVASHLTQADGVIPAGHAKAAGEVALLPGARQAMRPDPGVDARVAEVAAWDEGRRERMAEAIAHVGPDEGERMGKDMRAHGVPLASVQDVAGLLNTMADMTLIEGKATEDTVGRWRGYHAEVMADEVAAAVAYALVRRSEAGVLEVTDLGLRLTSDYDNVSDAALHQAWSDVPAYVEVLAGSDGFGESTANLDAVFRRHGVPEAELGLARRAYRENVTSDVYWGDRARLGTRRRPGPPESRKTGDEAMMDVTRAFATHMMGKLPRPGVERSLAERITWARAVVGYVEGVHGGPGSIEVSGKRD